MNPKPHEPQTALRGGRASDSGIGVSRNFRPMNPLPWRTPCTQQFGSSTAPIFFMRSFALMFLPSRKAYSGYVTLGSFVSASAGYVTLGSFVSASTGYVTLGSFVSASTGYEVGVESGAGVGRKRRIIISISTISTISTAAGGSSPGAPSHRIATRCLILRVEMHLHHLHPDFSSRLGFAFHVPHSHLPSFSFFEEMEMEMKNKTVGSWGGGKRSRSREEEASEENHHLHLHHLHRRRWELASPSDRDAVPDSQGGDASPPSPP
jgi:hypothetical protein